MNGRGSTFAGVACPPCRPLQAHAFGPSEFHFSDLSFPLLESSGTGRALGETHETALAWPPSSNDGPGLNTGRSSIYIYIYSIYIYIFYHVATLIFIYITHMSMDIGFVDSTRPTSNLCAAPPSHSQPCSQRPNDSRSAHATYTSTRTRMMRHDTYTSTGTRQPPRPSPLSHPLNVPKSLIGYISCLLGKQIDVISNYRRHLDTHVRAVSFAARCMRPRVRFGTCLLRVAD